MTGLQKFIHFIYFLFHLLAILIAAFLLLEFVGIDKMKAEIIIYGPVSVIFVLGSLYIMFINIMVTRRSTTNEMMLFNTELFFWSSFVLGFIIWQVTETAEELKFRIFYFAVYITLVFIFLLVVAMRSQVNLNRKDNSYFTPL